MGKNPFKGLYCYEEDDKDIFYGRENEAAELFSLVALNGLTVVFGKSGIGKTSLLNAGLFPLLREEEKFLPVRMRLDYSADGLPLLDQVKQAIQNELEKHDIVAIEKGGSELTGSFAEGESLWEYFHRVDHINKSFCGGVGGGFLEKSPLPTVIPVLVFDQFEELFTIGKHHGEREKLLEELYWLIEDQVPPEVKERVLMNRDMVSYLRAQAVVRVVFGLREDYLPHLNALKRRIPSIHRVLFRIIHLNGDQAREVMDKSGAFREEKIKQELLQQFYPADMEPGQTVVDEKLEVEPALLSLLCYQVFEQWVETLSGREKDSILADFYDQVLGELPRGKELAEWIETHLLTEGGYRTPLYLERGHELRETVDAAIDKKLLRKLYIGEKEHVEIIHDVLAPMIKKRRNQRIEEKRRIELEKEKKLQRKRVITAIIAVAGIIAILLAIIAFVQKNRADKQYIEALEQKKIADESKQSAIKEKSRADALRKIADEKTQEAIKEKSHAEEQRKKAEENMHLVIKEKNRAEDLRKIAEENEKMAQFEKNRADELNKEALNQKNRADEIYRESVSYRLASVSSIVLPNDNYKAIRIAEAGYNIGLPSPPAAVVRALSTAAYSTRKRPFYIAELKHEGEVRNAVFSPDGSKILTVSEVNTAKLWDLQGNILSYLRGHTDRVWSAVFSPDGRKILTASSDKTAKLWDLQGKLLADLKGHADRVISADFSPDSSKILTASDDTTAKLWDLSGKLLADLKGHTGFVRTAVFSPDGSKILTASWDTTAKLWDLQGNLLADLKWHICLVIRVVFSPDGSKVLTASCDETAKLWDLTENLLSDLKGHTGPVISTAFSPGGSKILTASNDKTAKLWDLQGKLLTDLKGHKDIVTNAVFSPDGSKILTASDDKTAKLWDLKGNLLADLRRHSGPVNSAVFSPDGKRIVTASADGTAIIWLTPEGIIEYLKTAPIPKLTQQEKEELGIAGFKID